MEFLKTYMCGLHINIHVYLQEVYHKPAASVQCWHVHCEECWLRTLVDKIEIIRCFSV